VETPVDDRAKRPELSLWDAASLMIGIVVGTSLFVSPRWVFSNVPSAGQGLLLWAFGGVLSTIGALLFAELAVSFPRGGSYTYLTAAFGRTAGLVYGVALLSVMLTANIGAMAFAFARYTRSILMDYGLPLGAAQQLGPWLAAAAVLTLAIFNTRGFQMGRLTQNLLTAAKLLGLGLIVVAGFSVTADPAALSGAVTAESSTPKSDYGLAMVIVLYAFGGWSDAAAVAAEVRNRRVNIPRALIGGLAAVTAIYVIVNLAYVRGIGFAALGKADLPARDVVTAAGWGRLAEQGVSLLVMVSALGAVQGMLFSGSRAIAAMGADHSIFRPLSVWNRMTHVPTAAVWALALVSLTQIGLVGTAVGQRLVNVAFSALRAPQVDWSKYGDGFDVLVYGSAPTFWALMLGVGVAYPVLRRQGRTPTEYRAPGGPLVPIIYLGVCGFMFWRATLFAGALGVVGLVAAGMGLMLAAFSRPTETGQQAA
jgi:APA family basic amino acid/polyamine antiporter